MPLSGYETTGNPYDDAGGDWYSAGGDSSGFTAAPVAKKGGGFDLSGIASGLGGLAGGLGGFGAIAGMGADVAKAAMGGTSALASSNASPFYNNANISFGNSDIGGIDAGPVTSSATATADDPSRQNKGGLSPQSLSSGGFDLFESSSGTTLAIGAAIMGILIVAVLFFFGKK